MPIFRQSDPDFWKTAPDHLKWQHTFATSIDHGVASWALGGDPKNPEAPLALLMRLPPHWVLSRHSHDCHRFEVVIWGEMIVEGAVLKPGDVSTSAPGEQYGHHMAGPNGCLSLEMFSRQAGMLPEQRGGHGGEAMNVLMDALMTGRMTPAEASQDPAIKQWAKDALAHQPELQAEVRQREGMLEPAK